MGFVRYVVSKQEGIVMDKPLFLACADVHICENAPSFRSEEPDWFAAQARQLEWLGQMMEKYEVPLVIAGDIFDRAQGSTRLVNFIADHFPKAIACPGNHDLPYHSLDRLDLSSYGSLLRMGKIDGVGGIKRIRVHGHEVAFHLFPYGEPLHPCESAGDINVAVIHHFVWVGDSPLSKFMPDCELGMLLEQMPGYDYYVFGDNHEPFHVDNVINCGSFFRRKKGDEDYQPTVPLVYANHVQFLPVPVHEDIVTTAETKEQKADSKYDFEQFFQSLKEAEKLSCDISSLLQEELLKQEIKPEVRQAIIAITSGI